jgi:hypothetical protein
VSPSPDDLKGKWTGWQEGKQCIVCNELRLAGKGDALDRLMMVITDEDLRISTHYRPSYSTRNCINLIGFANPNAPLKIRPQDRRWFVLASPAKRQTDAYYDALWANVRNEGSLAAVKHFLQARKVALNANEPAPMTAAKEAMSDEAQGDFEAYLAEIFDLGGWPFDFELVRLQDVERLIEDRFKYARGVRKAVIDFMRSSGAERHEKPGGAAQAQGLNFSVWSIRNHEQWAGKGGVARNWALQDYRAREIRAIEEETGRDGQE